MAKAVISDSIVNTRTLPLAHGAAVEAGDIIVSNGNVLITVNTALINVLNSYVFMGKVTFPKVAGIAMAPGDKVYFDVADGNVNKSPSGNTQAGICIEAALSADTEVVCFLLPNAGAFPALASHYVFAAGVFTTVGGDVNETITIAGMLGTDIAICTLASTSGTARSIVTAVAAAGQINVVMSGDPLTGHTIAYQVLRAAA